MRQFQTVALGALLLACVTWIPTARAATEAEKLDATRKGLAYLYNTQQSGGYWSFSGYEQAATGAAVSAFLNQQDMWDSNAVLYQAAVDKAIAYLLNTANTINVSTRNDGINICPGRAGACIAVYWFGNAKSTFTTGLVAPAIAAYGLKIGADVVATENGPLAGMTWGQIAQAITNAIAASQSTGGDGDRAGGWGYLIPGNGDSDSFNTESAVISLLYDEALGAMTPDVVKDGLKIWLSKVQNARGAACSQPGTESCGTADTGSWLVAMRFVGFDLTSSQLQIALAYLNTEWKSSAGAPDSSFGQSYAMWAVYKGLTATIGLSDTTHITKRITNCNATASGILGDLSNRIACTWSEDYNQWLVDNQKVDGSWGHSDPPDPFAVAFSINILGATQIPMRANSLPGLNTLQSKTTPTIIQSPPAFVERFSSASSSTAGTQGDRLAVGSNALRKRVRRGVTTIAMNGDGTALASASTDKRILVWNPGTGGQRLALQSTLGLPTGLAFSRDGSLISVGRDSVVRLWDGASGRELAKLAGHENAITAVAASPNGALLATAGEGTRIMLWDQPTRKLTKILFGSKDFVNTLSFSPDSRLLASAGEDTRVLLFDVATGKVLFTLLGHSGSLDAVAFSPNGTVLASAGQDTEIHLWDPVKGQQRQVLRGHSAPIRTLAFSPDGRLIASAGEDSQIRLWNVATGTLNKVLTGSAGAINAFAFDPKGLFLASASESGEITFWNVISGTKLITIRVPGAL